MNIQKTAIFSMMLTLSMQQSLCMDMLQHFTLIHTITTKIVTAKNGLQNNFLYKQIGKAASLLGTTWYGNVGGAGAALLLGTKVIGGPMPLVAFLLYSFHHNYQLSKTMEKGFVDASNQRLKIQKEASDELKSTKVELQKNLQELDEHLTMALQEESLKIQKGVNIVSENTEQVKSALTYMQTIMLPSMEARLTNVAQSNTEAIIQEVSKCTAMFRCLESEDGHLNSILDGVKNITMKFEKYDKTVNDLKKQQIALATTIERNFEAVGQRFDKADTQRDADSLVLNKKLDDQEKLLHIVLNAQDATNATLNVTTAKLESVVGTVNTLEQKIDAMNQNINQRFDETDIRLDESVDMLRAIHRAVIPSAEEKKQSIPAQTLTVVQGIAADIKSLKTKSTGQPDYPSIFCMEQTESFDFVGHGHYDFRTKQWIVSPNFTVNFQAYPSFEVPRLMRCEKAIEECSLQGQKALMPIFPKTKNALLPTIQNATPVQHKYNWLSNALGSGGRDGQLCTPMLFPLQKILNMQHGQRLNILIQKNPQIELKMM